MPIQQQIKAEKKIKAEIVQFEQEENKLQQLAAELQTNPKFAEFLEAQKAFREMENSVWKGIEAEMIANDITQVKTDRVTLSIAKRVSFDIDTDTLPAKYFKKVPDTTKITNTFKLEGKPVKGTTPKYSQYLVKRIK